MRPEQKEQKKPQEICQGCGDMVSFYAMGPEHRACGPIMCCQTLWTHKTIYFQEQLLKKESRNEERQNEGFEMLDQALREATFTPGIYGFNSLI